MAKQAKGEWLAFLNPDAYADSNWLEEFAAAVKRYPDVEAFGSAQIDALNRTRLDGAGDVLHILGIAYRGYYGERFFCYGEDVDLGYRHRLNGGRTIQLNRAIVYHEGSAITGRHSDFTIYHGHRNRIWFMYKNTPFWLYWPFLPLHIFANIYLFIRALIAGIGRPYLRAMLDGYRGAGQFKADRKAILKTRQGSYWFLLKSMEWSPFKIFSRRGRNWPYRAD